ncbi:MAG: UDP-N-acetylmuramoyl-tripeptide--D-alanyl-D-alanine ligase [Peptococcaceae bacterium]|mgnify:CR=1 FL=1|jgi:UDP-N-acetylmuramoyl-tripeptide--D-alanyl-D-alanine ligase|nr:UDP-N-acetylmuramoyl-tripeptide--D-alanyl-D-alanine ligase [Peptococcaceae bacterium]
MLNSGKIAEILGGTLQGSPTVPFLGCAIDSRRVQPGEMFVALAGENTDGHKFIPNALEAGAGIVLAERRRLGKNESFELSASQVLIICEDSLASLQQLAKYWRQKLNCQVIAITGSNGKTTTKDMVAAVLAQRFKVHSNLENQNNELGLPLTILKAPKDTEVLVLEMGMRGLGQIAELCAISSPNLGIITNIGTTHLELLGSQENIARAKWELIESLPLDGTAILNTEDYFSMKKAKTLGAKKIFYGITGKYAQPDLYGSAIRPEGMNSTSFLVTINQEKCSVKLPLPGEHNVLDALAALAAGYVCGVQLEDGARALENFQLSKMRLEFLPGLFGSTLINDVYNANPTSMKASLKILAERGGNKTIAVLGEMYELGALALAGHREVGQAVAELGIKQLVTVGKLAEDIAQGAWDAGYQKSRTHVCPDWEQAVGVLQQLLEQSEAGAWVLLKGSRGMKMERISEKIRERN